MNCKKIVSGIFAVTAVFAAATITLNNENSDFSNIAITAEAADDYEIISSRHARVGNILYYYNEVTGDAFVEGIKSPTTRINVPGTIDLGAEGTYRVTAIYKKAFANNTSIKALDLSKATYMNDIFEEAFKGASNLQKLILGPNIVGIGKGAFQDCAKLNYVGINGNNKLYRIFPDAFSGCTKLTEFAFPNSMQDIMAGAFSNTGLTDIMIPNNVTNIGPYAFSDCKQLKTVKFEAAGNNNKLSLAGYVFKNATSLQKVDFQRRNMSAIASTFEGANYNVKMVGPGAVDYTQNLCKNLLSDWKLTYNPNASVNAQKQFFSDLTKKLQDYITYDSSMDYNAQGCAASVLSIHRGTCGGFSRSFYNCCLAAGVSKSSVLVGGDCHCHAFNYVKINGYWYVVDSTNSNKIFGNDEYSRQMIAWWGYNNAHLAKNFYVCVDNQTGGDDEATYANPTRKLFDVVLSEHTANGVPIYGTRYDYKK